VNGPARLPERCGVGGVQVNLVVRADPEPDRLIRPAAIEIVVHRDSDLLCHPGLPAVVG
jgi:hypothetical protein